MKTITKQQARRIHLLWHDGYSMRRISAITGHTERTVATILNQPQRMKLPKRLVKMMQENPQRKLSEFFLLYELAFGYKLCTLPT